MIRTEYSMREVGATDENGLRIFLEHDSSFPGSMEQILINLSNDRCKTILACNGKDDICGFIQIQNSEILFIAVDETLRGNGLGQRPYESAHDRFHKNLPGLFARVEDDHARRFWMKMGFCNQDAYYLSIVFPKQNHCPESHPFDCHVKIDVLTELNEPHDTPFETQAYRTERAIALRDSFIRYIHTRDDLLHISVDGEMLPPKKIKYAEVYGIRIIDDHWGIIIEIPHITTAAD